MKTILPILLTCICVSSLWAQPANDDCSSAQELVLGTPPACPSGSGVINTFPSTNIGATPITPYPSFNGCTVGGSTNGPAAEVWYKFVPNSNMVSINVNGDLDSVTIILFSGSNCSFLYAIDCARGGSTQSIISKVIPGQQYHIMVSGADETDQGDFILSVTSFRDCSPCLQSANLEAFPPSVSGLYSEGQEVTFCFTIDGWNVTGTVEWLHAIEVELGAAWDLNTLVTTAPPSCGGEGYWAWYNSWTSCNTGQTFGPGFAYDSHTGVSCGGDVNDGLPGNNWGDGVDGCSNITPANAFTFCWTIKVAETLPDTVDHSLNVTVRVLSDGDSGSWTQTGCNNGIEYQLLASAIPFTDDPPLIYARAPFCAEACSGQLEFSGASPSGDTLWNYLVFNEEQDLIFHAPSTAGVVTLDDLCSGFYTVMITNPASGSTSSVRMEVPDNAGVSWMQQHESGCEGLSTTYTAETQDTSYNYFWIFEGGQPATATGAEVEVSYANTGTYMTTLISENSLCSDTLRRPQAVVIVGSPSANFETDAEQAMVEFGNTSQNSDTYEWHFGDGETSTESDPVHTYSESGDYLVQLIATNLCGSDTITKEVGIVIVGIEDVAAVIDFKLYPNPNSGNFLLEIKALPAPLMALEIYDALGQIVYKEDLEFRSGQLQKPITLTNASAGVYWVSIKTENFNITRKVIIGY